MGGTNESSPVSQYPFISVLSCARCARLTSRSSWTSAICVSCASSLRSAWSSMYCNCSACKLAMTSSASMDSWSFSWSLYAADAAYLPWTSLICLSFSPIIHFCRPLSSSNRASSVVSLDICALSTPPSFPPPKNDPNPEEEMRERAASPSSTVIRVRSCLISSTAESRSARFTPSSVSRIVSTAGELASSRPIMLRSPAFSARIFSFSSACCDTIIASFSLSQNLIRSTACTGTLT